MFRMGVCMGCDYICYKEKDEEGMHIVLPIIMVKGSLAHVKLKSNKYVYRCMLIGRKEE